MIGIQNFSFVCGSRGRNFFSLLLLFVTSCNNDQQATDADGEIEAAEVDFDEGTDPRSIHFYSATQLVNAIQKGQITSVELLELYIDRIEKYNHEVNAVVALSLERARERAAAADLALAQGDIWGPLHGLPITIKDTYEVAGLVTTSGDPELADYVPETNAIAVQRLVEAGAIIIGKTNVPYHGMDMQSYNDVYGTTNNPWNLDRTAGGSSGGAAAALAAGLTSLELGSDIGGSIRIPSNFNGVFGHKTSFGIVPRYGHIPPLPGTVPPELMNLVPLFVSGPLARSAEDLLLALEILTTPVEPEQNPEQPELSAPRRQRFTDYRVAVWLPDPPPFSEIQDEVLIELNKFVDRLIEAGLDVDREARPEIDLTEDILTFVQAWDSNNELIVPLPSAVVEYQQEKQAKWEEFFQDYDVLLVPVTPTVAFPHDHSDPFIERQITVNETKSMYTLTNMTFMTMAILSGLPATVAPIGISESCFPVGIQIIGAYLEDRSTIDFAIGLSDITGGFVPPPDYE